jgi:glutathione synthase/RimK-type ligase-like ATP-grasp enzyme
MECVGIDVGLYQKIELDVKLDQGEWGRVVVIKPEVGRRGREVKVMRTGKVRWEKFASLEGDYLAQEFVYTGEFPVSYRVLTFCGRAMFVQRSINKSAGEPLISTEKPQDFSGKNIVATTQDSVVSLVDDSEVREFAESIARTAFGEIPCLGIDLLRDCRTGRLVVAEVNPWGQTWHISSEVGRKIQKANGLDYRQQFGLEVQAAEALVDLIEKQDGRGSMKSEPSVDE